MNGDGKIITNNVTKEISGFITHGSILSTDHSLCILHTSIESHKLAVDDTYHTLFLHV